MVSVFGGNEKEHISMPSFRKKQFRQIGCHEVQVLELFHLHISAKQDIAKTVKKGGEKGWAWGEMQWKKKKKKIEVSGAFRGQ